jgi:hypothetical protein
MIRRVDIFSWVFPAVPVWYIRYNLLTYLNKYLYVSGLFLGIGFPGENKLFVSGHSPYVNGQWMPPGTNAGISARQPG